ncbi:MAG: hypothetical protein IJP84_08765 [Lachnospiraceae bacterium]|nr:hypothetical protein [Lachnospiraceae bacterium]
MSEGIQYNGQWRNGATLDFSGINSGNIDLLVGKGFTFTCTQSCQESFQFIFEDNPVGTVTVDGQNNDRNPHIYHIGIGGISNGAQLVNAIFDGVYNNPVNNATYANNLSLSVSHSNIIVRPSVNSATFSLIGSVTGSSKENAASKWQNYSPGMGVVDCDSLTGIEKRSDDRRIWLQASDNNGDGLNFVINRMNSKTIGVNGIDLTTIEGSRQAIDTITHGLRVVGMERASIGAQQNRLEHSIKNIDNVAENTSAAESRIRDTNMADEMVKYSKDNILQQAGQAMLVQANQANQGVLSLLQ